MCYYDHFVFACHDWKWGNFRQHCHDEYRTGETCGSKLVFDTIKLPDICPWCDRIEKKMRRKEKALSDIRRWTQEPHKYRASIEKACGDVKQLDAEIQQLQAEKDYRYLQFGNQRRKAAA